jgi:GTP-binding protein Era
MQIVYSDTPGVLHPNYKLQQNMLQFAHSALDDADVLLYVTDVVETIDKNEAFLTKIERLTCPVLIAVNKIDLTQQNILTEIVANWHARLPLAQIIPISALIKFNIEPLKKQIISLLPDSPPYFDKNALTDRPAKFFVTEIIREKILICYQKEIPYATEVAVELFNESNTQIHIKALIVVERDSQKGIIIGHKGLAIKKMATAARKELEIFFEKKIFLEIFVKVVKDWRNNSQSLQAFGYQLT